MKYALSTLLPLVLLLSTSPLMGQSSAIDRYYGAFQEDEDFTRVTVSSKMFSLFVNFEMDDPDEQALVETISKLKGLKMLVGESISDAPAKFKQALQAPSRDMDELMSISDDQEGEVHFFITETDGRISEVLMVAHSTENLILLSVVGDIDLKTLAALSKKMNLDGFDNLQYLQTDKK